MDGFLPLSRAPFSLDLVALGMFFILPVMFYSIFQVRFRARYSVHRRWQIVSASVLLVALTIFEIDIHSSGWQNLARPSPYFDTWLFPILYGHLAVAIATALVWIATMALALLHFHQHVRPGSHSPLHRLLGRAAAIGLTLTSVSGWVFYYIGFIA